MLERVPGNLTDFKIHRRFFSIVEFTKKSSSCAITRIPYASLIENGMLDVLRLLWKSYLRCQASFNPTQIFGDEVTEEKGENARLSAFVGAIAVGDLVKSTLGPKGMDKILQSA